MSKEKIIQQIMKDSDKEIKQIQTEAEKQATNILKTAKKEAELEAEKIIANGKNQSENIKKILLSKAHQETKRDIMKTKEKLIDECFIKAQHELSVLKQERYEKIVSKFINDGKAKLGGNCTVKISRSIDKNIAERFGLTVSGHIESSGGIILISADKRVTLDYTFEGILKREKDKIRIKVGKLLFS